MLGRRHELGVGNQTGVRITMIINLASALSVVLFASAIAHT